MITPARVLRLRPLVPTDEAAFRAAHDEMTAEGFTFGLGLDAATSFADYVANLDRYRYDIDLPPRWVRSTFLVADVKGEIVGRSSIRHELNHFLLHEGGHIGYGVLRAHRGHGYATDILRQSLVIARAVGVGRALVTCDDANLASATVIERCGGVLESTVDGEAGDRVRRYWID